VAEPTREGACASPTATSSTRSRSTCRTGSWRASRACRTTIQCSSDGSPAAGAALVAQSFCGTCAAYDAELARSDRDGTIQRDEFYPEEWDEIAVGEPDAEPQWRADPRTLPSGRTVRVAIE
jgi:hypothetical protein